MKSTGLISTVLLAVAASADNMATLHAPGKAVFWVPASTSSSSAPEYRSQSVDKNQLHQMLMQAGSRSEIIAYLKMPQEDKPVFTHQVVVESIRGAPHATVVPFIYHSNRGEKSENFVHTAEIMRGSKAMSLADFSEHIRHESNSKNGGLLNNDKVETYEITLTGDAADRAHIQEISKIVSAHHSAIGSRLPITFVAMEHPHPEAVMPKMSAQYSEILASGPHASGVQPKDKHVSRILSSDTSAPTYAPTAKPTSSSSSGSGSTADQGNSKSIYYKPEGAEYSIYYADTYLYLTPDIFTGLLTGIFVFFTLLVGLSCLNQIQGPSTFANKLPVLGKEA